MLEAISCGISLRQCVYTTTRDNEFKVQRIIGAFMVGFPETALSVYGGSVAVGVDKEKTGAMKRGTPRVATTSPG
jgi:hypothetical protein